MSRVLAAVLFSVALACSQADPEALHRGLAVPSWSRL